MTPPKNPILGRNHKEGLLVSERFGFEDTRIKAEDVKKEMDRLSASPKILFIGGTHPRHLYYANQIHIRYPLAGAVLQDRGGTLPKPPDYISTKDRAIWLEHFGNRAKAEEIYFGRQVFPEDEIKTYDIKNMAILEWIRKNNPDIVLIFGCGLIKNDLAEALPELTINLHLGLSPRYRGAATLFWPFYFLEPQWAGCTFHKIVDEPDAGDILHQCVPELKRGDRIHDVAAKAVVKATEDMIKLLGMWSPCSCGSYCVWCSGDFAETWGDRKNDIQFHSQSTTGKNFLSRDFQPSHLRMIYETYNDDIVDQYLDGNLKQHKPKLVRQF